MGRWCELILGVEVSEGAIQHLATSTGQGSIPWLDYGAIMFLECVFISWNGYQAGSRQLDFELRVGHFG